MVRWRAEADKKGYESEIPMPPAWLDEMKRYRRQLHAVAGWIFPGERKPERPMDRHPFDRWLAVAEAKAGLPKLQGGLWHPYRRMWATARKDLPLKDVAAAGGWRDIETLLTCYQQPDRETLLRVMQTAREVPDRALEEPSTAPLTATTPGGAESPDLATSSQVRA